MEIRETPITPDMREIYDKAHALVGKITKRESDEFADTLYERKLIKHSMLVHKLIEKFGLHAYITNFTTEGQKNILPSVELVAKVIQLGLAGSAFIDTLEKIANGDFDNDNKQINKECEI